MATRRQPSYYHSPPSLQTLLCKLLRLQPALLPWAVSGPLAGSVPAPALTARAPGDLASPNLSVLACVMGMPHRLWGRDRLKYMRH